MCISKSLTYAGLSTVKQSNLPRVMILKALRLLENAWKRLLSLVHFLMTIRQSLICWLIFLVHLERARHRRIKQISMMDQHLWMFRAHLLLKTVLMKIFHTCRNLGYFLSIHTRINTVCFVTCYVIWFFLNFMYAIDSVSLWSLRIVPFNWKVL